MTLEELKILITAETSQLRKDLANVKQQMSGAEKEVRKSTGKIGAALKKVGVMLAGVFAVKKMFDFGRQSVQAFNGISVEAAKLAQVMRNTMGATDAQVQSIKNLAAAQEAIGVIGADIQIAGAQELGTYLSDVRSLQTLLPTLNNMLAQQYGMDATSGAAVNIGSMIGKVMEGQLGALSRYGYSWDAAQEKVLKHGNELERAAMLAEVISQSVGGMNEQLAKTPVGMMRQLSFTLGSIKEELGKGLMSVLQRVLPYLQAAAQWLLKITQYVSAFLQALFGPSQSARAVEVQTGAVDDLGDAYEEAGKKARKSVAGFDQVNLVGGQNGAGEEEKRPAANLGSWAVDMSEVELGVNHIQQQMEGLAANVKQVFGDVWGSIRSGWKTATQTFGPTFKEAWDRISPELGKWKTSFQAVFADIIRLGAPLKDWTLLHLVPAWQSSILTASNIVAGLSETVRTVFNDIWEAVFPIIQKFVVKGLPRLTEFAVGMGDLLYGIFEVAKQIFDDIWRDAVSPAMDLVSKIIQDVLDIIFGWWDAWGAKIMAGLKATMDGIKSIWNNLWNVFLKPFVENMLKMLTWLWDKHLKGLVEEIGNFIGKLVTGSQEIYTKFIVPLVNYLIKTLGPTFSNIFSYIGDVVGTAVGIISDVLKGLIKSLGGVIDFIVGVFTGDWKKAWGGIQKFMEGFSDALVGIFKGAVNLIIDALNFMVRSINNIKIDIPDWVPKFGGESIGFKIPEIPKLAVGTNYVAADGLAYLHEGEAVVPKKYNPAAGGEFAGSDLRAVESLLGKILRAAEKGGHTTIALSQTMLTRSITEAMRIEQMRSGRSPMPT